MTDNDSRGMSLKKVSILTLCLVSYFLWGGAAAIHQGHQDQAVAAAQAELEAETTSEFESDGVTPRIRVRRVNGLIAVVVITVAAIIKFVVTSVTQLAELPQLIPYMFQERIGYLVFCVVVLAATGLGLLGMGKMQQSLESGNPFAKNKKKRKKLPGIRIPKPLDD